MDFPALLAQTDRAVLSLGGPVRYVTGAGRSIDVTGVFDLVHVVVGAGTAGAANTTPAVFLRLEDLVVDGAAVDPEEDSDAARVVVNGTSYRVQVVRKDGHGGVTLLLAGA